MGISDRGRWTFAAIIIVFASLFSVLAVVLRKEGGVSKQDAWLLLFGGFMFGFTVAAKTVSPEHFVRFGSRFRTFVNVTSWVIACLGPAAFVLIWISYFCSSHIMTTRSAWQTSGISFLALMALTPNGLATQDWLAQIQLAALKKVGAQEPQNREDPQGDPPDLVDDEHPTQN
jgi:hypothetical protein